MEDYYQNEVNHEELIDIFQFFFGASQRSSEYKLLFTKKTDSGKQIEMIVHFSKKYKIKKIDDSSLPEKVKNELRDKIKRILLGQATKRIARTICFVNQKLKGAFRYRDMFQFFPIPEEVLADNSDSEYFVRSWPFILEFEYDELQDAGITTARKMKKLNSILRILTLLTRYNFKSKQSTLDMAWGFRVDGGEVGETKVFQAGYYYKDFQFVSTKYTNIDLYSKIDLIEPENYYQWTFQDMREIKMPTTIVEMIDKVYKLTSTDKTKFDIASTYFQKGINVWNESHSVSFICYVVSIEALIEFKKEVCSECGQNKYSVRKRFNNFLDTYLPETLFSDYFKKIIYDTRSSLSHGSKAFQRDIDGYLISGIREGHEYDLQMSIYFVMRVLFYNWLYYQRTEP